MVFLNAGYVQVGAFREISHYDVQQMVSVNTMHPAYMFKVLIKQLLAREKRSAVVVTSATIGDRAMAGSSVYAGTKSFTNFFGQAMHYEHKDKIDIMSW